MYKSNTENEVCADKYNDGISLHDVNLLTGFRAKIPALHRNLQ